MKLFEWPIDRIHRMSQYFGDNPKNYSRFGLLGHSGIDWACPIGTRIYSCDTGTVREIFTDNNGYGLYIKIEHEWGESIYAHLSKVNVVVGEFVAKNQGIALSGNTGNSTGPHLHFGIRIKPYSRNDGWNGHSDPYPYLLDTGNTSIIGPHIVNGAGRYLHELRKLQPAIALVLDPNPDDVRNLRIACPNTKIIGRIYKPDHEVEQLIRQNPINAAREMHKAVIEHPAFGLIDYWQGWVNEVCQVGFDDFDKLVACELERMKLAQNYTCGIFAFSVGQPDLPVNDRMAYWNRADIALKYAEDNGHIVVLHQYGCQPNIWGPSDRGGPDWLIHRLEHQVLPLLKFKKLQFAVTEFGHDYLIVSGPADRAGYRARPFYSDNYKAYADDLINIGRYLERFRGRILGYAVFTLGHNSPWGSFDIEGIVLSALANNQGSPEPPSPNLEQSITEAVNRNQVINVNPDAALTKKALELNLPTQVTQEIEILHNQTRYLAAKFENLSGSSYIIYAEFGKWDQVKTIKLK